MAQNILAQQKVVTSVFIDTLSDNKNNIVYRKGIQIVLEDFQGISEIGSTAAAMTYSGLTVKYVAQIRKHEILLDITLSASFDKSKSWCLNHAQTERTRIHEQRHFEITAINACQLFRLLKTYPFTKNFEAELNKIQNDFREKLSKDQEEYDSATKHGIDKERQSYWNQKIIERLETCNDCFIK
jgi:hypothetical protein